MKLNIIKNRKLFMTISAIIILIGLIVVILKGFNYGIDFTGGTIIEMQMDGFIETEEIEKIMDSYDKNATILYGGSDKSQVIIKSTLDLSNDDLTDIVYKFIESHGLKEGNYQSKKFEPIMGAEIKQKSLVSMSIAVVAMLIYITIRFEFTFGLSAIVALVHDMLIMIAFYAIFRVQVNSSFIAAILTILGYSINDTIVIFDRIRENRKLYPRKDEEFIINSSINQSIRRTINTSITTFIAILVVFIFGVDDMKVLALPLMIGVIAGTYSSIFIASPIWYEISKRKKLRA